MINCLKNTCDELINNCKDKTIKWTTIEQKLSTVELSDSDIVSSILDYMSDNGVVVIMPEDIENFSNYNNTELSAQIDNIDVSDAVKCYLKSIDFAQLTAEEEIELANKIKNGDTKARDKMINHNLKLVVSVAKKYYRKSGTLDFMDIIQAGNLGLMKAVEKFDPDLGYKFSTYATWWIRQSILRTVADEGRCIRMPVYAIEQYNYIKKAINNLEHLGYEKPTLQQITDYVNEHKLFRSTKKTKMTKADVEKIMNTFESTDAISLQSPIGDEEDTILGDFIPDNSVNIEYSAEMSNLHISIEAALSTFSDREADIIRKRFGLNGNSPMTLEQIASGYGITRERVRQIESKALRRLRSCSRKLLLKDF